MAVLRMRDLADELGLTRTTVSRAVNNDPRVSARTRLRVLEAMKERHLEPNMMARSLAKGRTMTIGLAVGGNLRGDYIHELMVGLEPVLEGAGYSVLLGISEFNADRERSRISAMIGQRVEGIISQPLIEATDCYVNLARLKIPLVFLTDYIDIPQAGWVVSDAEQDSRTAMRHLFDLGHRRIAYVGPKSRSLQIVPRPRVYREMMAEAGLSVPESYFYEGVLGGVDDIYDAVHRMMQQDEPPTAFFAAVDLIGVYVLDQLQRDGFAVPSDVSVVAIGNMTVTQLGMVQMTVVDEDRNRMARTAAKMMLDMIEGKAIEERRLFLPGKLIERRTAAVCKASV